MGVIFAKVFGHFAIRVGEREFASADLGGPRPKELLELLLMARGEPVAKEVLADRLWGEEPPKNANATLETYVSGLRKRLFADRATAREVLATVPGAYQFRLVGLDLDVVRFDRALAAAERGGPDALEQRRAAAKLAVGDLLEDNLSAGWIDAERELYRDRVTRNNVLAADELIARGEYSEAMRLAERALRVRPYAEEAVRAIMLANHGLGQTELSRQVYERFCDRLGIDLGRDCTSETANLAGLIDAGATVEELCEPSRAPAVRLANSPIAERRAVPLLPFVGRRQELESVMRTIEWSRRGAFATVLVRGPSGIGRTSFLREIASRTEGLVGVASMSREARERPGLPLADAVVHAVRDTPLAADAERYASAPLLSGEPATLKMLHDLLERAGAMVLLLDDLQWADPATVVALGWLRQHAADLPITVVAAVRESLPMRHRAIDLLLADTTVRLDAPTTQEWLSHPDAGIDEETVTMTGGQPLLMPDLHRWRSAGRAGVPPSLNKTVLCLVRSLGVGEQTLLQRAALSAEPFSPEDLRADEAAPLAEVDSLIRLCDQRFLEQVGGGFRFVAPLVRDVVAGTVVGGPLRLTAMEGGRRAG
jgi:DNA-binding SARP family transcriptional activator